MSDKNPKPISTNPFTDHLNRAQATNSESTGTSTRSDLTREPTKSCRLVLEIEGISPHSWEDASRRALADAHFSGPVEFEIIHQTGTMEYGRIKEYRIGLRVYSNDVATLTNSSLLKQQSPPIREPSESENLDPFLEKTVRPESQKELAEHYQAIHNLGEKEKGDKK